MVSIIILYYNIMVLPLYMRSFVGRNVVMRRIYIYIYIYIYIERERERERVDFQAHIIPKSKLRKIIYTTAYTLSSLV